MPSRMIRDALLNSDRFLSLPDNTARMCYVACLLTADDRGNLEASPAALVRLWRDFGVNGNDKAIDTAQFLADKDLIRLYDVDSKRYLHVPRFQQRMRSFKRACPPSPWCENVEESTEGGEICQQVAATSRKSRPKRSEEKGREVKAITPSCDGFEIFWGLWPSGPRKASKSKCAALWVKRGFEPRSTEIARHVEHMKTSKEWRDGYIPAPMVYLNQERWDGAEPEAIEEERFVG